MPTPKTTSAFSEQLAAIDRQAADLSRRRREIEHAQRASADAARVVRLATLHNTFNSHAHDQKSIDTIRDAATRVTRAVAELDAAAQAWNNGISEMVRAATSDGIGHSSNIAIPPSPQDGGLGRYDSGIRDDRVHLAQVNPAEIRNDAILAVDDPQAAKRIEAALDKLVSNLPTLTGRFWRDNTSKNVVTAENPPNSHCTELHKLEFLSWAWDIPIKFFPAELLATLTPKERAQLAKHFLDEDDPNA